MYWHPPMVLDAYATVAAAAEMEGPHGWIQWKGTDVCIDVHCECGAHLHFDEAFLYFIRCGNCRRTYGVSPYVKIVEVPEDVILATGLTIHLDTDKDL